MRSTRTPTGAQILNLFVQAEPWPVRDKAMIDSLKTIGIEEGRPFNPDRALRRSGDLDF
jgi:hypothetical protein